MRTAQQLNALGVPSSYHKHARYFVRLWGNLGWTGKQIDEGIKFGVNYGGNGSEEDLSEKFRWFAAHIDAPVPERSLDAGLGLRDTIVMNGLEALPQLRGVSQPAVTDGSARLAQIREISRNDPNAYESNKALQREELSLIEASLPTSAPAPQAASGDAGSSSQSSEDQS
jgi:hypothetical protein